MAAPPSAGLDQRMLQRLRRLGLTAGAAIGVAFSGGNDSLALAITLSRCAALTDIRPVLLHIDHQLRPESGDDLRRCVEIAERLELPILTAVLPAGMARRSEGSGLEHRARVERYGELAKLCDEAGAGILATAHHQNDQAETVLMHLFRGSGLDGVSGMRELGPPPVDLPSRESPLLVWRPFLTEPRNVIENYVVTTGFDPVVDDSNVDIAFRRNAVRHDILPVIERHFPGVAATIGRFARLVQEDAEYLKAQATEARATAETPSGALDVDRLTDLPLPLATRVVRAWLINSGVEEPTAERVHEIVQFAADGAEEAHLEAGAGLWVVRDGRELVAGEPSHVVSKLLENSSFLYVLDQDHVVVNDDSPGSRAFRAPGWTLEVFEDTGQHTTDDSDRKTTSVVVSLPEGVSLSDLQVRKVHPGDRLHATGAPVREVLRTAGVHPLARRHVVCIAADGAVLLIPGYYGEATVRSKTSQADSNSVHIRWKKEERSP